MKSQSSSSGTNYVLNEHGDIDWYGPYTMPSELRPVRDTVHVQDLLNKLIELTCYQE